MEHLSFGPNLDVHSPLKVCGVCACVSGNLRRRKQCKWIYQHYFGSKIISNESRESWKSQTRWRSTADSTENLDSWEKSTQCKTIKVHFPLSHLEWRRNEFVFSKQRYRNGKRRLSFNRKRLVFEWSNHLHTIDKNYRTILSFSRNPFFWSGMNFPNFLLGTWIINFLFDLQCFELRLWRCHWTFWNDQILICWLMFVHTKIDVVH